MEPPYAEQRTLRRQRLAWFDGRRRYDPGFAPATGGANKGRKKARPCRVASPLVLFIRYRRCLIEGTLCLRETHVKMSRSTFAKEEEVRCTREFVSSQTAQEYGYFAQDGLGLLNVE